MFKERRSIKVNGELITLGYDKYTQDSNLHLDENMVALNHRFPNLCAYGFIQYLKELMAENPACKIEYSPENISKMSHMMNMEESLIKEILNFCFKELKMMKLVHTYRELRKSDERYIVYPDFLMELITLQAKRIGQETEIRARRYAHKTDLRHENEVKKKKRMIAEIKEYLKLTDELKKKATMFYPTVDIDEQWELFVDMIEGSYLEWHTTLNVDNYADNFYIFLNKMSTKLEMPEE